jgi:hypothetical protein
MSEESLMQAMRNLVSTMRIGGDAVPQPTKRMTLDERRQIVDTIYERCRRGFRDEHVLGNAVWALEEAGLLRNGDNAEIARLRSAALLWRVVAIGFGAPMALVVLFRIFWIVVAAVRG